MPFALANSPPMFLAKHPHGRRRSRLDNWPLLLHAFQNLSRRITSFLVALFSFFAFLLSQPGFAASTQSHYYAHDAVTNQYGVIAPWYQGLNGQCDLRIRIAAETLKRYPWTTTNNAIAAYPDYLFTSKWQISSNGVITPQNPGDWMNGDLGQRSVSVLNGMVDYYRYSGDAAAIAQITYMGDYLLDHALTPTNHPWPKFPISVPVKGVAYGDANPHGMIQLDISADMGRALLRAYEVTGNPRWLDAAKHWGDLFAAHCNLDPSSPPWPRYANPADVEKWHSDKQTGGVTMIVAFLDELLRLHYNGKDDNILAARQAGVRYLKEKLLPRWSVDDTWAYYFWDWVNPVQNCSTTADVSAYLISHKTEFPNWTNDARNILTEFLMRSSANPDSHSDTYHGAWAYPESSSCCGRSLWYAPLLDGAVTAQLAVESDDARLREIACRQFILQTYDVHENGVSEDNIDGGIIVNGAWLNIAHPLPLRWVLAAVGWLPEELGASRENHLVRSSAVVNRVVYGAGRIFYSTFDAHAPAIDVLRLSFVPKTVNGDIKLLSRHDLAANGYTVKKLPNGDCIVQIRHDGMKNISIEGNDPQSVLKPDSLQFEGAWTNDAANIFASRKGASVTAKFRGNQVRVLGAVAPACGLADVFLDGEQQLVPIDFWNPAPSDGNIVYYKNGLANREHTLKIVARGEHNAYSTGNYVIINTVEFSAEDERYNFPAGGGSTGPQRMIFGYTSRKDFSDHEGNLWRPGTEVVFRAGHGKDSLAAGWWTKATNEIVGTPDSELYCYGLHGREFWINLTVGPGKYDLRLAFANARGLDTANNPFDILINGKVVAEKFDVTAAAGGVNKPVSLLVKNVVPANGVIEIRCKVSAGKTGEAFIQALELAHRLRTENSRVVATR